MIHNVQKRTISTTSGLEPLPMSGWNSGIAQLIRACGLSHKVGGSSPPSSDGPHGKMNI